MNCKKVFSVLLITMMIFSSVFCVFSSAEKINEASDAIDQDAMDFIFGSPEGFDREMKRIILEDNNNILKLEDLQKMDRTADGKFAPTKNNLRIVLKSCELNDANAVRSLPSSCDISSIVPLPGDQGILKSCTSWAFVYAALSAKEVQKRGWTPRLDTHIFSPSHVHNSIVQGNDRATYYDEVINYFSTYGASTVKYFAISDTNCAPQPNDIQLQNASLYKGTTCGVASGISAIKQELCNGNVVVLAIREFYDFINLSWSNQIYDSVYGDSQGNHSIALVGYDDTKGSNGAFRFINSWGTNWGLNGYGWISYNLVTSSTVNMMNNSGYYLSSTISDNYLLGDLDGDGTISVGDSRIVLNYSVGNETPSARQFVLSDVDGDGTVTVADSRHVLRYATALITKMPIYD